MISFPGMGEAMLSFLPPFTSPHISIISDYVESCMLQETPDHKLFYLAIEIAVNEGEGMGCGGGGWGLEVEMCSGGGWCWDGNF